MKKEVILFFLIVSSVFVSGELSVSCQEESDCRLALGDSSYHCVDSFCQKDGNEEPLLTLEAKTEDISWDLVVVEEKKELCPAEACLSFAPGEDRDTWVSRFINFLFYL